MLLVFTMLGPAFGSAQHLPPDEDIGLMLRYLVEDGKAEGIVVGLLEADGSTRVVSYGNAGPDARPLGPRSVFQIGSITKTFTATLLADMVARGEVALEEPVSKYLPEEVTVPSKYGREITLLDLATHRAGLPRNYTPSDPEDPTPLQTMNGFLSSHELRRIPGTEFEYSNLGFQLLGQALARAAGMTFAELNRRRLLEPLGMTISGYALEGDRADWMTQGHRNGQIVPSGMLVETHPYQASGALHSNVEEMLTYLKANVGPPETDLERAMRMAHEARAAWGEGSARVGLAWKSDTVQGRLIVEHRGNTGGFSSLIAFDPERRVGIVLLTNTFGYSDNTPVELLAYGPRPAIAGVRLSPETLVSLAGEYLDPSGSSLYVRREDEGYLTVQSPGRARARIFAESDTSFTLDRGSDRLIFNKDESGEVLGVRMEPSRSGETARKVGNDSPPPRAVAAGNEWHRIGIEWQGIFSVLLGGMVLLTMLTLGAELRRVVRMKSRRGS
jgi:CubicO group peptidase (beta-lactamase class C family)